MPEMHLTMQRDRWARCLVSTRLPDMGHAREVAFLHTADKNFVFFLWGPPVPGGGGAIWGGNPQGGGAARCSQGLVPKCLQQFRARPDRSSALRSLGQRRLLGCALDTRSATVNGYLQLSGLVASIEQCQRALVAAFLGITSAAQSARLRGAAIIGTGVRHSAMLKPARNGSSVRSPATPPRPSAPCEWACDRHQTGMIGGRLTFNAPIASSGPFAIASSGPLDQAIRHRIETSFRRFAFLNKNEAHHRARR